MAKSPKGYKSTTLDLLRVVFPTPPGPNFPHASNQTVIVQVTPPNFPSVRIVGITTSNPLAMPSIVATGTAGEFAIGIQASTLLDNQVYILAVWTTVESGAVTLDTRPAG